MPFPSTARPAGVPTDSFAGGDLYPVPEPSLKYPWGKSVSLLEVPLIMTASHLLYRLDDGFFWIARRGAGGIYLHARLTRDGWIQANGTRFWQVPALIIAAAGLVSVLLRGEYKTNEWGLAEAVELIDAADCSVDAATRLVRAGVTRG